MAYEIKVIAGNVQEIARTLACYLPLSRFTIQSIRASNAAVYRKKKLRYIGVLTLDTIRLKAKKEYCGNHAGPCQLSGHKPDKKMACLEGADWVGFNDMVNDALDQLGVSADVGSSACDVRRDYRRRMLYDGVKGGAFNKVENDEFYLNRIGEREEHADILAGTPGLNEWRLK